MRALCLLFVLLGLSAQAQVYRGVGPDGGVIFSDRPLPNADQLDLPSDSGAAEAASTEPAMPTGPASSGFTGPYDLFEIVAPANEQKIRDSTGDLPVSLVLAPALQEGHRLNIEVDGVAAEGTLPSGAHLLLRGLVLGSHTIRGAILGPDGMTLAATPVVNVHLMKALPPSAQVPVQPQSRGDEAGFGVDRP